MATFPTLSDWLLVLWQKLAKNTGLFNKTPNSLVARCHGQMNLRVQILRTQILVIFKIAIGQVIIVLGVGEEIGGKCIIDVPRLSFREPIQEHCEAVSLGAQCYGNSNGSRVEK